ncbi:MAG: DUF4956 domain-containing protein [Erysipelotrichaceae bacterium]|nr:DUF4956 domain-containing protein [Erysipelotrichaceae bacterium]MDD3809107.1 DUF4956 domain-containing protein [Erysipelotrichaceae bacterium]
MLNSIIEQLATTTTSQITLTSFFTCMVAAMVIGLVIAKMYEYKNSYNKGFVITLAMLPSIVTLVIMMVNGNIGTGVAVAGAFSLVRFRSQPGSAREINAIFFTMATGLATGMGYLLIAVVFTAIMAIFNLVLVTSAFGEGGGTIATKEIRITIPENLDYENVFSDIFERATKKYRLVEVKTTNMGSLFKLRYEVEYKEGISEKELIDQLRCRNGNLEISSSYAAVAMTEL